MAVAAKAPRPFLAPALDRLSSGCDLSRREATVVEGLVINLRVQLLAHGVRPGVPAVGDLPRLTGRSGTSFKAKHCTAAFLDPEPWMERTCCARADDPFPPVPDTWPLPRPWVLRASVFETPESSTSRQPIPDVVRSPPGRPNPG